MKSARARDPRLRAGAIHTMLGKHGGMLSVCVRRGWETATISLRSIRCQREIASILGDLAGMDAVSITHGSTVAASRRFRVPIVRFAHALARFAAAGAGTPHSEAARRIFDAMAAHPEIVGEPGASARRCRAQRASRSLPRRARRILCGGLAGRFRTRCVRARGQAAAGDSRSRDFAVTEALFQLGILNTGGLEQMAPFHSARCAIMRHDRGAHDVDDGALVRACREIIAARAPCSKPSRRRLVSRSRMRPRGTGRPPRRAHPKGDSVGLPRRPAARSARARRDFDGHRTVRERGSFVSNRCPPSRDHRIRRNDKAHAPLRSGSRITGASTAGTHHCKNNNLSASSSRRRGRDRRPHRVVGPGVRSGQSTSSVVCSAIAPAPCSNTRSPFLRIVRGMASMSVSPSTSAANTPKETLPSFEMSAWETLLLRRCTERNSIHERSDGDQIEVPIAVHIVFR